MRTSDETFCTEKKVIHDAFIKAFGENGSAKRKQAVKEMCNFMGTALKQEYRLYENKWWLWTLGKPARPLTEEEINEHSLGD